MTKYILLGLVIIFTTSCICQKKAAKDTSTATTETVSQSRFIVSFFSRGSGIDHAIKKEYISFLQANYSNIKYDEVKWGREGETDYCFGLDGIDSKKVEQFIQQSKDLLAKSQRVRIKENTSCRTPKE